MKITSPKFKEGEEIPSLYTADGKDWNPPLHISGVPKETKSLVLIMDDPDVPAYVREEGLWVHWVVYGMPANMVEIKENTKPIGIEGTGTSGDASYLGPAPPDRRHRYFFTLYALDIPSNWPAGLEKEEVLERMEDHILARAQLMGTYERKKK